MALDVVAKQLEVGLWPHQERTFAIPSFATVGRIVDVHVRRHLGRFRTVIETGDVNLTIFSSPTAPSFAVGDLVAVSRVDNRWDAAHRVVAQDPVRWTGLRDDALAYLMSASDLRERAENPRLPVLLPDHFKVGASFRASEGVPPRCVL